MSKSSPREFKPISKSDFRLGLNCPLKLTHKRDRLPSADAENDMLRLLAEGGGAAEALLEAVEPAHFTGPDGGAEAAEPCEKALQHHFAAVKGSGQGASRTLREITIVLDGFLARIDGLSIYADRIEIVEQKSSTIKGTTQAEHSRELYTSTGDRVKSEWVEYFQDLGFQVELLRRWLECNGERLGIPPQIPIRPFLMLLLKNSQASAQDTLSNFESTYRLTDSRVHAEVRHRGGAPVTTALLVKVDASTGLAMMMRDAQAKDPHFARLGIAACMDRLRGMVSSGNWPQAAQCIGSRCRSCEFRIHGVDSGFVRCWGKEPAQGHVLELTRLTGIQFSDATAGGAPADTPLTAVRNNSLTPSQRRQWEVARAGRPWIDSTFAADPFKAMKVSASTRDVAFLDFETCAHPIPARVGGHPYEQLPFQFEAHVLPAATSPLTDRIGLKGFLDLRSADPRRDFIDELKAQLSHATTVYHWSPFERTVLSAIRESLEIDRSQGRVKPKDKAKDKARIDFIDAFMRKLVDLMSIAKGAFLFPEQRGSYSIKRVLPVVWKSPAIRSAFATGAAPKDTVSCDAASDPYLHLPALDEPFVKAVGGSAVLDERENTTHEGSLSSGGTASLYYHYCRLFNAGGRPEIAAHFREYCRLDSAAMAMAYAFMRGGCRI